MYYIIEHVVGSLCAINLVVRSMRCPERQCRKRAGRSYVLHVLRIQNVVPDSCFLRDFIKMGNVNKGKTNFFLKSCTVTLQCHFCVSSFLKRKIIEHLICSHKIIHRINAKRIPLALTTSSLHILWQIPKWWMEDGPQILQGCKLAINDPWPWRLFHYKMFWITFTDVGIWGSHSGEHEDYYLLGWNTVYCGVWLKVHQCSSKMSADFY
jgi:hypothetical protein